MPPERSDIEPRHMRRGDGTPSSYSFTAEQVYSLVWQAAGAGSGAVMRLAPTVVMPTEDINEALGQLMAETGIPAPEGYR